MPRRAVISTTSLILLGADLILGLSLCRLVRINHDLVTRTPYLTTLSRELEARNQSPERLLSPQQYPKETFVGVLTLIERYLEEQGLKAEVASDSSAGSARQAIKVNFAAINLSQFLPFMTRLGMVSNLTFQKVTITRRSPTSTGLEIAIILEIS